MAGISDLVRRLVRSPWSHGALALLWFCCLSHLACAQELDAVLSSSPEHPAAADFGRAATETLAGCDGTWLDQIGPLSRGNGIRHAKHGASLRLRGRIDTDAIAVSQSAANQATFGELDNVVGLRRARVGIEGQFTDDSRYVAEIDLASGQVVIRDLLVGVGQLQGGGEFRIGHMREPFSLEGGTSANTFAFMERSAINSLDPARNWGVGYSVCSEAEDATLAVGLFASGTDSNDFEGGDGSDNAVTGRGTWLPWHDDDRHELMHFGAALSARVPEEGVVVIDQGPNSPLLDFGDSSTSSFVPTIRVPASFQQLLNLQWAYAAGPFSTQAEWYGSLIDQTAGDPLFFHGGYLSTSYFLTGEHRSYQKQHGVFGPVTVARPLLRGFRSRKDHQERGFGAWELTARLSYLDFSDPNTPTGPLGQPVGVTLPQVTAGVNWYLADHCRILFNYMYSAPDEPTDGRSSASVISTRLGIFW